MRGQMSDVKGESDSGGRGASVLEVEEQNPIVEQDEIVPWQQEWICRRDVRWLCVRGWE